jgi:hypothetical protein
MNTHVMVGDTHCRKNVEFLREKKWGRMFCNRRPTPFEGERWGFDNGAYIWWRRGQPFDESEFCRRVEEAAAIGTPMLAVLPDIPACGCSSLEFSLKWRERPLPDWSWYLAVQDGMTIHDVKPHVGRFAGIFLGGTDSFKTRAWTWCRFAHDNGLRFHYGRAGTLPKMKSAVKMGADSLDSAFPLWERERFDTFWKQYDGVHLQRDFPYMERA